MSSYDMYLSYTGFKKYVSCPQSYYLEYVERKRPPVEDQRNTLNGNSLHNLLEEYMVRGVEDPKWIIENADRVWEETLEGCKYVQWRHDDDAQELKQKMRKWSTSLAKLLRDHNISPEKCDPELKADTIVEVDGIRVKMGARLDIVAQNSYNQHSFLDLKASENRAVMELDQIVWYAVVLGKYLGDDTQPKYGGYILPGFNELKIYEIPTEAKENLLARLGEVLRRIQNEVWTPTPDDRKCFWCPVKYTCPAKGRLVPHGSGVIYL